LNWPLGRFGQLLPSLSEGVFWLYRVGMLDRDTKEILIGFALLLLFAIALIWLDRLLG
jgi:hypothetical protein